jgi:hypothetical protein
MGVAGLVVLIAGTRPDTRRHNQPIRHPVDIDTATRFDFAAEGSTPTWRHYRFTAVPPDIVFRPTTHLDCD